MAAHASARTLGDALTPLNGLIPFVVPLRTLRARGVTFPAPAELPSAADLVVDTAPEGWAGRVLESGRALLLVDGLDEVPPEDREQTHTWLARLLARYPDTRCVATVRPLAVDPDWLRSEGFAELRLLPMRSEDIQAFVASWHRAALLSEPDDAERLDELERDLSHQFDQNPTLRDLARTPLLCAVICALHRRRDGFLPETRWKLYRSALEMLLGHRDHRRRIGSPEGIDLDVEESTQLLQRIAVWLVREGQSEFTRDQALRQLDRALAGMERVGAQGPPEKILTHPPQPQRPAPGTHRRHLPVHSPHVPGLPGREGTHRGRPPGRTAPPRGRGALAGRGPAGVGALRAARTGPAGRGPAGQGTGMRGGVVGTHGPPCPRRPVRPARGMARRSAARTGAPEHGGVVPADGHRRGERPGPAGPCGAGVPAGPGDDEVRR
ncbi:NACHT domain-containing protein [Streptomyces sp. S1A(2023)]